MSTIQHIQRLLTASTFAALILCLTGCGEESLPGLVAAEGVVTYQGKPVDGATITFVPLEGGRAAGAITDGNGHFSMNTLTPGDGVFPGQYQVKISKKIDTSDYNDDDIKNGRGSLRTSMQVEYAIPKKYDNPKTSGLSIEINEDGNRSIEFLLD